MIENVIFNNAILGVIVGFLGKVLLDRFTFANKRDVEVDVDMRKRRLDVYPELWKLTELLPKWPRNPNVTYEQLGKLQKDLMTWYFNKGGIYLSRSSFDDAYRPLQETLTAVSKLERKGFLPKEPFLENAKIGDDKCDVYDAVREACSKLRSALTQDVESRREAPIWTLKI